MSFKKGKVIISLFLASLFITSLVLGVGLKLLVWYLDKYVTPDGSPYVHPDFKTEYTIDEHIERITEITKKNFAYQIHLNLVKEIYVDIVYAFYDNDPEYFLVELEFTEEMEIPSAFHDAFPSKYGYIIGYILNDRYYCEYYYDRVMRGRSGYTIYGKRDCVKYYGMYGIQAVLDGDKMIIVYDGASKDQPPETHLNEETKECYKCLVGTVADALKYEEYTNNGYLQTWFMLSYERYEY